MCIGDDPVARAMPFIIAGIISVIITVLLYALPIVKKWKPKYVNIAKIVMIIISLFLLFLIYLQFTLRVKCI